MKSAVRWLVYKLGRLIHTLAILAVVPLFILTWFVPATPLIWILRLALSLIILTAMPVLIMVWVNPKSSGVMRSTKSKLERQEGALVEIEYRWVDYDHISPAMRLAVVVSEDRNYLRHHGFAWGSIYAALKKGIAGQEAKGLSTISQQVAKNLFLWAERSLFKKVLETYFTLLIEGIWSKKRILEVYINIAQFGTKVFGAGAAAGHFFNKQASQLTWEEAALLAAVLPMPRRQDVSAPSHWVRERQDWILKLMAVHGEAYISQIR
jgi:monofunctional biosynthetic peptidoglycan transglycosylase